MRVIKRVFKLLIVFTAAVAVGALLLVNPGGWPGATQAAPLTLPPRPGYDPGAGKGGSSGGGESSKSSGDDWLIGAYIELQVQPGQAGLWTIVQWQDSSGGWHDVEGWRGSLEAGGYKRWWVAPKDFNTGPFQWVVYQKPDGLLLATSAPFTLPYQANVMKLVEVSLGP
jgi:hypothetical protein